MATYYRWRKSTVSYAESGPTKVSSYTVSSPGSRYYNGPNKPPVGSNGQYNYTELPDSYVIDNGHMNSVGGYVVFTGSPGVCYSAISSDVWIQVSTSHTGVTTLSQANMYTLSPGPGTSQGYVYSTSSSAYPNGGVQDGYYYDQRTSIGSPSAPSSITYPEIITSSPVTVSWGEATSNIPGVTIAQYLVQRYENGSTVLKNVGYTSGTSMEVEIDGDVTSIQFVVRPIDSNDQYGSIITGPISQVLLAPTLTVPQMVMQGQQATINWTTIEGADSYTLQRKANTDADWTQVYSGANLTFSETVGTWTTVQYRVQAVFSDTPGGWAESASIPVVSSSALVISGTDEDLGVVTNDIPYSISTDTGNQITATITVNNAVIFSGNVGNSTADVIPVLDLITGEGTIVISATVDASGSPVTATRTWTYEKAAITFPNSGSVAQVTKEGENIYPKVLAEGVRLPGGKTLDQVMGFPAQIYTGSYVGTGTYGQSNPNTLTLPFVPKVVFVTRKDSFLVSSAFVGFIWLFGQDTITSSGPTTFTVNDNGLSWYSNGASNQLNVSGTNYVYVALG